MAHDDPPLSSSDQAAAADVPPGALTLEAPDYLPISYLNALVYCPRRFYYEFAQGEMLVNEHVLQGRFYHRPTDAGGVRTIDGTRRIRSAYVYSDHLRISGLIDIVEVPDATGITASTDPLDLAPPAPADGEVTPAEPATFYPVELKKGSAHGGGANDQIQLCAQGLCLEERTRRILSGGYVFSFRTMHRTWIPFTPELRAQTEETIRRAFTLLAAGRLPPPLPAEQDRKCRACSLEPLCLPREVRALAGNGCTASLDDS